MVKVNQSKCIGCGLCVSICEKVFEMNDDGKAQVKKDADKESSCIKEAQGSCPVQAIN